MASFVLPIISGLAGLFGGGRQSQQQTSSSGTQNTSQSGNTTSTNTYNLSPYQQAISSLFTKGAMDLFGSAANMNPYTQTGMAGIAGQGQANNQIINNIMAQRGLSFSPAAATPLTMNALNTGNQMNSFISQIPLLQRQLQQSALGDLFSAFKALPLSTTQTGSSSQTGSTTSNQTGTANLFGNPMGGLLSGLGAGLAAPVTQTGNNYVPAITAILKSLGL